MAKPLDGRILLVTGASRGLGYATAKAATLQGGQVIATARTQGGLEALDDDIRAAGGQCTLLPLDLLEANGVERLGPSIYQRFGRLDALVHCAGERGPLTPTHQLKTADLRRIVELHAIAAQRLLVSTDPLLRAAPAGQAVFITDAQAFDPRPFWSPYNCAKAALEAIVASYRLETAKTRISVHLIDPEPMQTVLRRAAYPGEPDDSHAPPNVAASRIVATLARAWRERQLQKPDNSD